MYYTKTLLQVGTSGLNGLARLNPLLFISHIKRYIICHPHVYFLLTHVLRWIILDFFGTKSSGTTNGHKKNYIEWYEEARLGLNSFKPRLY